jgi:type I restriction enzyme S subunit
MSELPKGWAIAELDDLIVRMSNGANVNQFDDRIGLPISRIETIWNGKIDSERVKYIKECDDDFVAKYRLEKNDILFSHINSDNHLGKTAIYKDYPIGLIHGINLLLIKFHPDLYSDYFNYQFQFLKYKGAFIEVAQRAVNQSSINQKKLKTFAFCIPPTKEQKRIVAKIEELFSELDKGIESLKTARSQLKIYRQAVLKHAFEGKLTVDWREKNKDKLESAYKQINNIAKNDKAFNTQEMEDLPPIPSKWVYTRLANVGDLGRGKSKHRPRNDKNLFGGNYPFIQTGEIKAANRIVKEYSQTYSDFGLAQSKLWPTGTLCITIAANIAETAFLGFDACFPDSIVGFIPQKNVILPEYVDFFIQSVRARIEAYAPATAQKNINLTTLENLVIPLCSIDEQKEIVQQLDSIFSVVENNNEEIENNLQKSEALRQSILKKAFSGQLVAQDPTDEPASVLLERIRAEKAPHTAKKKPKEKRRAA